MTEKVVGTTYVTQKPVSELVGRLITKEQSEHGLPEFETTALLVPEPENPYDATAVAVYIECQNGQAHRVGYLSKESPRKKQMTGIAKTTLRIIGYSEIGYSDSYVLLD